MNTSPSLLSRIVLLGVVFVSGAPAVTPTKAASHLTDTEKTELKELAGKFQAYQAKHQVLETKFQAEKLAIENNPKLSAGQKQKQTADLVDGLFKDSNVLVETYRKPLVDRLNEIASNSPVRQRGVSPARAPIIASEGTKVGTKGFRGHWGDVDAEAGALTVQRLSEAAKILGDEHGQLIKTQMGKKSYVMSPTGLVIHQTPAYISIEGGLNLTVHASNCDPLVTAGRRPFDDTHLKQIGSSAYQQRIEAGATFHETYLAVDMLENQVGSNQVATQDHLKKAADGLTVDAQDLLHSRNEERLQSLAKGTLKSLETTSLSDAELKRVLKQSGSNSTPEEFRRQLSQLKSGYNRAPLAAGITSDNIKAFQEATRLTLQQCDRASQQAFDNAIKSQQQEIHAILTEARSLDATDRGTAQQLRAQASHKKGQLIDSKYRYQATRDANRTTLGNQFEFSPSSSEFTRTPVKAGYDKAGIPTSEKIKGLTADLPHSSNRAWSGPVPDVKLVDSRFWSNTGELSKKGMQGYFAYNAAKRIYESGDKSTETLKTLVELIPGFHAAKKYRAGADASEVWEEIGRELNPTAEIAEMITAKSSELMKESFNDFKQNEFVTGAYNRAIVRRKADGSAEVESINNVPLDMVFTESYTQGTINGSQAKEEVVKRLKQADPELSLYQREIAALKASNDEIAKLESKRQLTETQRQEGAGKRLENFKNIEIIARQASSREKEFDRDEGFVGEQFKRMLEHQYLADLESYDAVKNVANRELSYDTDHVSGLAGSRWIKDRGQELYQKSRDRFEKQLAETDEDQKQNLLMLKDDIVFNHFRKLMDRSDHDEGNRIYSARTRMDRIGETAKMEAARIYRNSGAAGETSVDNDLYLDLLIAMENSLVKQAILGDSESARENYRKSTQYQAITELHQGLKQAGIEEGIRHERAKADAVDRATRWCEKHGIPTDDPTIIHDLTNDILRKSNDSQKFYFEEFRAKRAQKAMLDGNQELALEILKVGQEALPDSPAWAALIKAVQSDQWPDAAQMGKLLGYLPKEGAVGVDKTIDFQRAIANGDKDAALAVLKEALGENPEDALWQGLQKSLEGWDESLLPPRDLDQLWSMLTGDDPGGGTNSSDQLAAIFNKERWGETLGIVGRTPPTEIADNTTSANTKSPPTPERRTDMLPGEDPEDPAADDAERSESASDVAVVPYVQYGIPDGASKRETKDSDGSGGVAYTLNGTHVCTLRWHPGGRKACEEYWISDPDPNSKGQSRSMKHGVWKSWNKEGVLVSVTGYDRDRRHGVLQEFSYRGLPGREEIYELGQLHGYVKVWERDGKLSRKDQYSKGMLHGVSQAWHSNGKLSQEFHYRNGKLHGVARRWTAAGVLNERLSYLDGKKHGLSYEYYEASGAPNRITTYSNGLKHGISRSWSVNGGPGMIPYLRDAPVSPEIYLAAVGADPTLPPWPVPPDGEVGMENVEHQMIAGKEYTETGKDGSRAVMYFRGKHDMSGVRVWYANGRLREEIPIKCHYRHGTHKEWNESGEPTSLGTYRYGEPFGLWREFYKGGITAEYRLVGEVRDGGGREFARTTGVMTREYTCKLGELSLDEHFDQETGKLIGRGSWDLTQGEPDPAAMTRNGTKQQLFSCNSRPRSHFAFDAKTEKLTSESNYAADGTPAGVWRKFSPDGLPLEETEYLGSVTRYRYFEDGTPKREETLKAMGTAIVKHGQESYWIEKGEHKGKLASITNYQDGAKHGICKMWDHTTYNLTTDETYENNMRHGRCKRYYGNGQLIEDVQYVHGEKDGPYKSYWSNGNVKSEGTYKAGKGEGWFSSYLFGNGALDNRSYCRDGKAHGPAISYDEKGGVASVSYWLNGGHAGEKGYREAMKKDPTLQPIIEVK